MYTFGFYNSLNHDRKYDARQFSSLIDCLITDGVFSSVEGIYGTIPGEGMQVLVKPGFAWFDHTWNKNDANIPLNIQPSDVTRARYDAVVLEVNEDTRTNEIKMVTGIPDTVPAKPELIASETVHQHALAYVRVPGGATSINETDIEIVVGKSECPFTTGILQTTDIDDLFSNWDGQFTHWFENLKVQLSGDIVANLQGQIDLIESRKPNLYNGYAHPDPDMGENGDLYIKLC